MLRVVFTFCVSNGASETGMRVWTVEGPGRANCQGAALALSIPGSAHAPHSLMTMGTCTFLYR